MTTNTMTAIGPKIKTALPGPNAKRVLEGDEKYISPSYTRSYPLVAKSGRGIVVTDVDGNEFFDFSAGIAVTSTGHCHPACRRRHPEAGGRTHPHVGHGFLLREHGANWRSGCRRLRPCPARTAFITATPGAEAVECALKLARYHTKRQNVIAFFGAFHGRTMGALSLTASKPQQRRRFAPLVPGVTHVRYPDVYRGCMGGRRKPKTSRWAAPASSKRNCSRPRWLRRKWRRFLSSRCRAKADTWWRRKFSCRNCGASAIVTASCWSWTKCRAALDAPGKWFAVEHTGVEPDMVCMAKGIASGMPLGVTMTRAEIMDWVPGSHASTFGGNPVCIAAALATLDVIEKEHLLENSASVGNHMMKRMADWPSKLKLVGDVRGRGLMIGVEIVKDKAPRNMAVPSATASSKWRSSAACCFWVAGRARCASVPRWW